MNDSCIRMRLGDKIECSVLVQPEMIFGIVHGVKCYRIKIVQDKWQWNVRARIAHSLAHTSTEIPKSKGEHEWGNEHTFGRQLIMIEWRAHATLCLFNTKEFITNSTFLEFSPLYLPGIFKICRNIYRWMCNILLGVFSMCIESFRLKIKTPPTTKKFLISIRTLKVDSHLI